MDISRFKKLPVMGILRGVDEDAVEPVMEAALSGGLETLEIAMNSANAPRLIAKAVKASRNRAMIGAGTVMNMEAMDTALAAGATFIVMPITQDEVIDYCVKRVIPVFPGAMTPTEVYRAWNAGATMVKVFPTGRLGPEFIGEIRGPFNNIELMACGGVRAENLGDFFRNGAAAVAIGGGVFKSEWVSAKAFEKIEKSVKEIVDKYRSIA